MPWFQYGPLHWGQQTVVEETTIIEAPDSKEGAVKAIKREARTNKVTRRGKIGKVGNSSSKGTVGN